MLEDQDGRGRAQLLGASKADIPNVNKAYCVDCKALWTPKGWIEYQIVKGRGPPVLILHGAPGGVDQALVFADALFPSTKDPKPLVPEAEENLTPTERLLMSQKKPPYTLIVVSRPGYLRTSLNEETETIREQSELLGLLLDELDLDSVAVVGVSGGGAYALDFAASQRNRCWGLVLVGDPVGSYSHWTISLNHLLSRFLPRSLYNNFYNWIEYAIKNGWMTDSRDFKLLLTASALFPFRENGYANDIKQLATVSPESVYKRLSNLTIPTLIVQGKQSQDAVEVEHKAPRQNILYKPIQGLDDSNLVFPYRKLTTTIKAFIEKHSEFLVYPEYSDVSLPTTTKP